MEPETCSCGQAYKSDPSPWCFWCSVFGPDHDPDVPAWLNWRESLDAKAQTAALQPMPEGAI